LALASGDHGAQQTGGPGCSPTLCALSSAIKEAREVESQPFMN